jgi:endonuclease/exonuclease/phosphatase family metal-dependent hydrolase
LSWNLKHGLAVPPAGRYLFDDFAAKLRAWEWDVALLQEVPPWWPAGFETALGVQARRVLTSRNAGLALRRAIAIRAPDLIKSNGGGANAILVRGPQRIVGHMTRRLCWYPERRWLHAVRVAGAAGVDCAWFGNLHLSVRNDAGARAEAAVAARTLLAWAGGEPCVLGGDFNVRGLDLDGFEQAARSDVDYLFAAGLSAGGEGRALAAERGSLSDHAPVVVAFEPRRG